MTFSGRNSVRCGLKQGKSECLIKKKFSQMPATHYDKKFLLNLGNVLGKAIKVDIPTAQRGRGKFARLYVELDLSRPLIPQYCIDGIVHSIEYECMNLLCLHCGRVGHVREKCEMLVKSQNEEAERSNRERKEGRPVNKEEVDGELEGESRWKVVQKPWRQRRTKMLIEDRKEAAKFKDGSGNLGSGSRFRPLVDITNGGYGSMGGGSLSTSVRGGLKERLKQRGPVLQRGKNGSKQVQGSGIKMKPGGSRVEVERPEGGAVAEVRSEEGPNRASGMLLDKEGPSKMLVDPEFKGGVGSNGEGRSFLSQIRWERKEGGTDPTNPL